MSEREKREMMESDICGFEEVCKKMKALSALLQLVDEASQIKDSGRLNEYEWAFYLLANLAEEVDEQLTEMEKSSRGVA